MGTREHKWCSTCHRTHAFVTGEPCPKSIRAEVVPVSDNPYAFDPRPPEKIEPEKWARSGSGATVCPKCGSSQSKLLDACVDMATDEHQVMLQCEDCGHWYRVPNRYVQTSDIEIGEDIFIPVRRP